MVFFNLTIGGNEEDENYANTQLTRKNSKTQTRRKNTLH